MGRSQESFFKKEVRNKKDKKRKEKEEKRLAKKDQDKRSSLDDMIAYVDENGVITSTPPDKTRKKQVKLEDIEIGVPRSEGGRDADAERSGVVKFFNSAKGYGFIQDSETGEKIFVHVSNVLGEISEGNRVTYVLSGYKSSAAVKVKVIGK